MVHSVEAVVADSPESILQLYQMLPHQPAVQVEQVMLVDTHLELVDIQAAPKENQAAWRMVAYLQTVGPRVVQTAWVQMAVSLGRTRQDRKADADQNQVLVRILQTVVAYCLVESIQRIRQAVVAAVGSCLIQEALAALEEIPAGLEYSQDGVARENQVERGA